MKLNVNTKYYHLLKSEEKTIELRLFDEKRRNIKIGDEIIFFDAAYLEDSFKAVVVNLYFARDFSELSQIITPESAGFSSKEELMSVMAVFYPLSRQHECGVLGIEVRKKNNDENGCYGE